MRGHGLKTPYAAAVDQLCAGTDPLILRVRFEKTILPCKPVRFAISVIVHPGDIFT